MKAPPEELKLHWLLLEKAAERFVDCLGSWCRAVWNSFGERVAMIAAFTDGREPMEWWQSKSIYAFQEGISRSSNHIECMLESLDFFPEEHEEGCGG